MASLGLVFGLIGMPVVYADTQPTVTGNVLTSDISTQTNAGPAYPAPDDGIDD